MGMTVFLSPLYTNQITKKTSRGGSRRVAKVLQESILITFNFIWKVLLSDRNFAAFSPLISYLMGTFTIIDQFFPTNENLLYLKSLSYKKMHAIKTPVRFKNYYHKLLRTAIQQNACYFFEKLEYLAL